MERFSIHPGKAIASAWANRALIYSLARRDVVGRYQGSAAGLLWSFFHPIFMLGVYTFFFSVIFQARWPAGTGSKAEFALIAFSGLVVFNFFVECVNRAPSLVISNANFVKKVIFPLDILPLVVAVSALFHAMISYVVWIVFYVVLFGPPHLTAVLFPLAIIPLILTALGISWFLASLGVFLRDVAQVVTVLTGALIFLSPIFYPTSAMPDAFQRVIWLNPLTPAIENTRNLLIHGGGFSAISYAIDLGIAAGIAWLGFAWFQKTRKGFADVL